MERQFKVGDRVVIEFDGHKTPGTIVKTNSYDESFVTTTTGTTWYDNSRLTLRGKRNHSSITKKDLIELMHMTFFFAKQEKMWDKDCNTLYDMWKKTLNKK